MLTLTEYEAAILQHFADLSGMKLEDYTAQQFGNFIASVLEPKYLTAQTEALVVALKDDKARAAAVAAITPAAAVSADAEIVP